MNAVSLAKKKTTDAKSWVPILNEKFDRTAHSLIELGEELNKAQAEMEPQEWDAMFANPKKSGIKFGLRNAQRYMSIASNVAMTRATTLKALPNSSETLYQISRLSPDEITAHVKSGKINPNMERKDVPMSKAQKARMRAGRKTTRESSDKSGTETTHESSVTTLDNATGKPVDDNGAGDQSKPVGNAYEATDRPSTQAEREAKRGNGGKRERGKAVPADTVGLINQLARELKDNRDQIVMAIRTLISKAGGKWDSIMQELQERGPA